MINNIAYLQNILNQRPRNLHRKASEGMILPPKLSFGSASFLEILGTVESPSHWRYFENKMKQRKSPSPSNNNVDLFKTKHLPMMKGRHFSPEASQPSLETGYPFNVEKILRRQAEENEKRQKFSLLLLKRRKITDRKEKMPEIVGKYAKIDQDMMDYLSKGDTSIQRFKRRIKNIQESKYLSQWKNKQYVDRLCKTTRLQNETLKSRLKLAN